MNKNIFQLVKEADDKKIVVSRDTWGKSWAFIERVVPKGDYGRVFGVIHYANGTVKSGRIQCAGNYSWRLVTVTDEDIQQV